MVGVRRLTALALVAMAASSCEYLQAAVDAETPGSPCPGGAPHRGDPGDRRAPRSAAVDYYAGTHKAPLSWDRLQGDVRRSSTRRGPTPSSGRPRARPRPTAGGWPRRYIPGMGTHHIRGGITPAMLADPSFDKNNPILDTAGLDDEFDPTKPEVLQFDGNGPTAKLVGFDYYVRTSTGQPPAGFPGNNDWWHIHPKICFRTTDADMVGVQHQRRELHVAQSGINVNMANYYMLHVWVLDDMKFIPDVYAGMIPCISGGTAIHDPNDPCHTSRGAHGRHGPRHDPRGRHGPCEPGPDRAAHRARSRTAKSWGSPVRATRCAVDLPSPTPGGTSGLGRLMRTTGTLYLIRELDRFSPCRKHPVHHRHDTWHRLTTADTDSQRPVLPLRSLHSDPPLAASTPSQQSHRAHDWVRHHPSRASRRSRVWASSPQHGPVVAPHRDRGAV